MCDMSVHLSTIDSEVGKLVLRTRLVTPEARYLVLICCRSRSDEVNNISACSRDSLGRS